LTFTSDIKDIVKAHQDVIEMVLQDDVFLHSIQDFCKLVIECYQNNGKILLCGNGGSAADAQHIAAEWQGRYLLDRKPLHAEALHANTSYITAVANDYGFEHVYSRAVEAQGKKGDMLIGLTTSGNSPNIVAALEKAQKMGMKCVGMTGSNPKPEIAPYCNLLLNVPSSVSARIQEVHILIGHIVCQLSEEALFKN